jgi:hypothetical protein
MAIPSNDKQYLFTKTGDDLSAELWEKVDGFQQHAIRGGFLKNWLRNKRYYEDNPYGYNTEKIIDAGETGELKATANNQFRNILRHSISAATSTPIAFDVSAANTDVTSRRASKIGKDLTNYYYKTKRVSKVLAAAAEKAQVYGDGYIVAQWNPFIGAPTQLNPETGKYEYEGDFDFNCVSPFDVFFDLSKTDKRAWEWVIFRVKRNKYDLAVQFETKAEAIIATKDSQDSDKYFLRDYLQLLQNYESNDIWLYAMYHVANNVLEKGKYCLFIEGGKENTMLYEGDNVYGTKLPIFPLSPSSYLENGFGFTEANVLRGSQEMLNVIDSALSTNVMSTSVVNFWTPDATVEVEQLVDGMNLVKCPQKPEVLNLMPNFDGLLKMIAYATNNMETQSGQNAVARGNIQSAPNLKSGVAIATVLQMAQQYNSDFINDFYDTAEDLFTFVLEFLQQFANTKRVYEIAGKTSQSAVASFTGQDLKGVGRVLVNRVNPILKQPAGVIEIASELLKVGKITSRQYVDVINTGNLQAATETDDRFNDYIQNVKERLLSGKPVAPIPGIKHQDFLAEIQPLLMDLDLMDKPDHRQIVQNITTLLQGHMDLAKNGDELSEFIHGGVLPSPPQVSNSEIPMLNMPAPSSAVQGAAKPRPQPMPGNVVPMNAPGNNKGGIPA